MLWNFLLFTWQGDQIRRLMVNWNVIVFNDGSGDGCLDHSSMLSAHMRRDLSHLVLLKVRNELKAAQLLITCCVLVVLQACCLMDNLASEFLIDSSVGQLRDHTLTMGYTWKRLHSLISTNIRW